MPVPITPTPEVQTQPVPVVRRLNAFFLFSRQMRPEITRLYPSVRQNSVSTFLSIMWSSMLYLERAEFVRAAVHPEALSAPKLPRVRVNQLLHLITPDMLDASDKVLRRRLCHRIRVFNPDSVVTSSRLTDCADDLLPTYASENLNSVFDELCVQ